MNKTKNVTIICLIGLVALLCLPAEAQRHPSELKPAPELKFKLTRPSAFSLSNGVQCYYLEDRELPLVSLTGFIRGGTVDDPADKAGLASLAGAVLRTGGTKKMTGDAVNEELAFLAASIESSTGEEFLTVSANCLKKDAARVIELYSDLIMNPEFSRDKLELARNQSLEGMRRRWDQPFSVAGLLFNEVLFGKDSAFGRRPTPASVSGITRQDLLDFHRRYFAPSNLTIGITGDISLQEARTLLEKAFRAWPKKKVEVPQPTPPVDRADGTVYYVYKDTPQGNVYLGHLGVTRNNPDEFKIEVLNDILGGGGFTARLMKELRSNRGLTYGIYGGVSEGVGRARGAFRVASQLKADRLVEAVSLIKDIIRDLRSNPVTDEELATAKNSLINSFVFRFERSSIILNQFIRLKLTGYPDNYLESYIDNIRRVTKADVLEAAKKYLEPEKAVIVVVGDEKRFDRPLSSLGRVVTMDLKAIQEAEK